MATFREGVLLATGIGIGAALSPGAWTRAAAAGRRGMPQAAQPWYISIFPYLARPGWLVCWQTGLMVSPDHSVTISAFSVAYLVLLHLGHHVLQQRAQPERAHRACAEWRA